ncbi:hypothetical protein ABRY23_09215 [Melioribacteraceae bacterium 4301-Me]|uniref:hypothetical protein n=1 Tax=Pyranulibacter aquaticus TaxID=3163344 RepID=UPI00359BA09F
MRYIVLTLLFISTSCDLLTTRTPQKPESPRVIFLPATSPAILFQNFKSSLEEKILENYLSCFVDTAFLKKKFIFTPSTGAVSQYSNLINWNLDAERQFFNNFISVVKKDYPITLKLTNELSNPLGSDSAVYQYDYELSFVTDDPTLPNMYTGSAQFKIYNDSRKQWVIVEWLDIKKENKPSWSELKGRLY